MTETFTLYGVIDVTTNKLVSNITNPRHKYWESKKKAQSAIDRYSPTYHSDHFAIHNGVRDKNNLKVVEIICTVKESDAE